MAAAKSAQSLGPTMESLNLDYATLNSLLHFDLGYVTLNFSTRFLRFNLGYVLWISVHDLCFFRFLSSTPYNPNFGGRQRVN